VPKNHIVEEWRGRVGKYSLAYLVACCGHLINIYSIKHSFIYTNNSLVNILFISHLLPSMCVKFVLSH
jgi:hypothetical protein